MKAKLIFLFFLLITLGTRSQNLIDAIRKGDFEHAKALATPEQINMTDENGATALMWAVYKGDLEFVKILHENGARTDIKGIIYLEDGSYYGNLMGIAAGESKLDVLKYLIEECRIDVDDKELNPENGKEEGWTALHWGVSRGNIEVTLYLLKNGADVNAGEHSGGQTPLIVAVDLNNNKILEILLKNNANVNYAGGNEKMTAIHYAAWNNDTVALNFLYKYGADVNQGEIDGWTPLHIAAVQRNEEAYLWIMDHGGDNTIKNSEGKSPADLEMFNMKILEQKYKTAVTIFESGNYEKADSLFKGIVADLKDDLYENDTVYYTTSLIYIAFANQQMMNFEEAEKYYLAALSVYERINAFDNDNITVILNLLVDLYIKNQSYEKCISLITKADQKIKNYFGEKHIEYAKNLNRYGWYYLNIAEFTTSLEYLSDSKYILEEIEEVDNELYASVLSNIGVNYLSIGEYEKSLLYLSESEKLIRSLMLINSQLYTKVLNNLGLIYSQVGDYLNAEYFLKKSLEVMKEIKYDYTLDYSVTLRTLASINTSLGNYEIARAYFDTALIRNETLFGRNNVEHALALSGIGYTYYLQGNYIDAKVNYENALRIFEIIEGPTALNAVTTYTNIGLLFSEINDIDNAIRYYEKAKIIMEHYQLQNNPIYYVIIGNMGENYRKIGKREMALKFTKIAVFNLREIVGIHNTYYLTFLGNLGNNYADEGKYKDAEEIFLTIINDTINYAQDYKRLKSNFSISLGLLYTNIGEFEKAKEIYNEALVIIENLFGMESAQYANLIANIGYLNFKTNNYDWAGRYSNEAMTIYERNYGRNNSLYITMLINQAYANQMNNNFEEAYENNLLLFDVYKTYLNDITLFLNNKEKKTMILASRNVFNLAANLIVNTDIADYDLLLNYELLLKSIISQTNYLEFFTSEIKNDDRQLFDEWTMTKRKIAKQLELSVKDRREDFSELLSRADELEELMNFKLKENDVFLKLGDISVTDIKKNLKEQEIAIEFSSFPYHNGQRWTDSTYYVALVLGKYYKHPKMIKLFEERELRALMPDATQSSSQDFNLAYQGSRGSGVAYYGQSNSTGDQLYELIWKPLDSLMEGINTVYYANSGLLHKVNLAAMPAPDGKLLLEKFQLNQLSSTRNLVLKEEEKPMSNAVVYGGIHYDMQQDQLANAVASVSTDTLGYDWLGATISYPELRGYAGKYGGFSYLPGSLYEAQQVANHLEDAMGTRLITGDKAVEESFTQLSGNNSPSVIHIATHGFYFPDTITQVTDRDMLLMGAMGEERFRIYDDPLLRSALVMAGANRSWLGEELPQGAEDGILTAKDVSAMNLSNTELVVLSACQTGLGEVDGTEGVTGLQRGFKMAGVKYVMMSLWPVPDKETAEFMETFYSYWGEGIREAFHKTQQFMANKYRNEPYKWAGFVLVE